MTLRQQLQKAKNELRKLTAGPYKVTARLRVRSLIRRLERQLSIEACAACGHIPGTPLPEQRHILPLRAAVSRVTSRPR